MMIYKINLSVDLNLWWKYLDTQLNESTNQKKSPKLLSQRIRKDYYSPLSPPFLHIPTHTNTRTKTSPHTKREGTMDGVYYSHTHPHTHHKHTYTHTNHQNRLFFSTSLQVYYRESAHTHTHTHTHTNHFDSIKISTFNKSCLYK